jgi:hypothetical protein
MSQQMSVLMHLIYKAIPSEGWITYTALSKKVDRSKSWVGYLMREKILPIHPELESRTHKGVRYRPPQ